jgi:hypothetical protein
MTPAINYIRFVAPQVDEDSHEESGIIQIAYQLRKEGILFRHEESLLQETLDWFDRNLQKPTKFTNAKPPYYRKRQNGISWFKSSAHEHIRRMREIVAILDNHDIPTQMLKTKRPGYIVYEDDFQVVAVSFAD